MNIGMLIWHYDTGRGGLEKTACSLTEYLTGQGHNVHIFYNRLDGDKKVTPYLSHPESLCHNLRLQKEHPFMERARALVAKQGLDMFIVHFSWHDMLWVPPLLHNSGIPLIYAEHNDPAIIQNERWNKAEHLACASAADHIVLLLDEFKPSYPEFLQKRISIIPNAVVKPKRTASPEVAKDGLFTLLGAGRLVEAQKQFSILLAAFAVLSPTFPDWRLRICGEGGNLDLYKQLAASFGIADKISFPGLCLDMSVEYAAANLFCIPSRYEGFGMVTVEAQSHGLPVVGFADCSGTNSLINHGYDGLLAPEMTVDSLVDTLRPLMKNHTLRGMMGKNGAKAAEQFFPQSVYKKWERVIAETGIKDQSTRLEFPLDHSEEAKAKLTLQSILLRENPFAPQSLFSQRKEQFSSKNYWEERYKNNGTSGSGSYNRLAIFKSEVINSFIENNSIDTVIEFGSGDGNQLSMLNIKNYIGFDVSKTIIERLKNNFSHDTTKSFFQFEEYKFQKAPLSMSIDVIFHLIEDHVFEKYMCALFSSSTRYIIIYSSNIEESNDISTHVRHRKFTKWINDNAQNWKCINYIENKYKNLDLYNHSDEKSFCDFYIYEKQYTIRDTFQKISKNK